MAAKIAVRHDETARRGGPRRSTRPSADPRGGADRPGHLPGARHLRRPAGRQTDRRRPESHRVALLAEPDPARTPGGRGRAIAALQGRPGADRRARGGAVDGRAPGEPVHGWRPSGRSAGRRDRRRPGAACSVPACVDAVRRPAAVPAEGARRRSSRCRCRPTRTPAQAPGGFAPRRRGPMRRATTSTRTTSRSCWSRSTDFDALCGFRDPDASRRRCWPRSASPRWRRSIARAAAGGPAGALRDAVRGAARRWPQPRSGRGWSRRRGAGSRCRPARRASWPSSYPGDTGRAWSRCCSTRCGCAPGEAVWMPAGNLHAYLRGAGVEIMAASDNVLRGGLTPKRVDVAELLRVLRFEVLRRSGHAGPGLAPGLVDVAGAGRRLRPAPGGPGRRHRGGPAARRRAADRALRARPACGSTTRVLPVTLTRRVRRRSRAATRRSRSPSSGDGDVFQAPRHPRLSRDALTQTRNSPRICLTRRMRSVSLTTQRHRDRRSEPRAGNQTGGSGRSSRDRVTSDCRPPPRALAASASSARPREVVQIATDPAHRQEIA